MNSSVEIKSVVNLTTQADILKSNGTFVEVADYSAHSLSLEIHGERIGLEHLVSLKGRIQLNSQSFPFDAIGKVVGTWPLFPDSTKIEVYLSQFNKQLWNQFLNHKAEAQNRVDDLFHKIKGDT